jgi:hypothetical protein
MTYVWVECLASVWLADYCPGGYSSGDQNSLGIPYAGIPNSVISARSARTVVLSKPKLECVEKF